MVKVETVWDGVKVAVTEVDGNVSVLFDDKADEDLLYELNLLARNAPPMCETAYPDTGTVLSYYNLFMSKGWTCKVTGVLEEIPSEDGVIY